MFLKCTAICTKVTKKSKSAAFEDLKPGDKMLFTIPIKAVGSTGYSNYTHAAYITCTNAQTLEESKLSFNQIERTLKNFEFEQLFHGFTGFLIKECNDIC